MKLLKLFIISGIVLGSSLIIILYFIESDHFTAQRTYTVRSEAAEGTKDDPLAHARFDWLRLRDPAINEIPKNIGTRELSFVKKMAKQTDTQHFAVTNDWVEVHTISAAGQRRWHF